MRGKGLYGPVRVSILGIVIMVLGRYLIVGYISPRGSKYPILKDSGPKIHTLNGFWDQGPYVLGTWTLWVLYLKD